jgi:hypothetical protein
MASTHWERLVTNSNNKDSQIKALKETSRKVLTDEIIEVLCKLAIDTDEFDVRLAALDFLRNQYGEKAANIFSRYSIGGTDRERRWAFMNLSLIGCRSKVDVIIKGLNDPAESVQRAAAMNVGLYQDSRFLKEIEYYFERNANMFLNASISQLVSSLLNGLIQIRHKVDQSIKSISENET